MTADPATVALLDAIAAKRTERQALPDDDAHAEQRRQLRTQIAEMTQEYHHRQLQLRWVQVHG